MTDDAGNSVTDQRLLAEFKKHEHFCRVLLDAYALIDLSGHVVKCNQLFSQVTGKSTRQIRKAKSFDELLELSIKEHKIGIADLMQYSSPTRIDEVNGRNGERNDLILIVGVYPFAVGAGNEQIGTFVLIRDVTAETSLQGKYTTTHIKSITDPLTGLFTRAYFEDFLDLQTRTMALSGHQSEAQQLSLIMVDIDFFKKVNDVHGHQAGDYVLRIVGGIMKMSFRKVDVVCRYGGEEFLIILPSTPLAGAGLAAEKCRMAVEAETFSYEGLRIPITISAGVAQISMSTETYTETMARADSALYMAKKNGRNQICIHNGKEIEKLAAKVLPPTDA